MKRIIFLIYLMIVALAVRAQQSSSDTSWALTRVSVANVRENPSHAAEMGSQTVMGTPLKISGCEAEGWWRVETPEGYPGYIIANSLQTMTPEQMARWRQADRVAVTAPDQTYIYRTASARRDNRLCDVVPGSVLEKVVAAKAATQRPDSAFVAVVTPDGRSGYIPVSDVTSVGQWAGTDRIGTPLDTCPATHELTARQEAVIDYAFGLMGTPYLWGGTSWKGTDCSGLVKSAWLTQGVILPRNASQQARIGVEIAQAEPSDSLDATLLLPEMERGDLLFFGNARGRVNHVGIYLGNGRFIHCSGRVRLSSLVPADDAAASYEHWRLMGVRRLNAEWIDRMSVARSPFYF